MTVTVKRPSGRVRTGLTVVHAPPFTCCSSRTLREPADEAAQLTGLFASARASGGSRLSTRTLNHVERRSSARRKSCDSICRAPLAPFSSRRLRGRTARGRRAGRGPPPTPSFFATSAGVSRNGPQRWCFESVSWGSATETRYGTAVAFGQASAIETVRPPEVEW